MGRAAPKQATAGGGPLAADKRAGKVKGVRLSPEVVYMPQKATPQVSIFKEKTRDFRCRVGAEVGGRARCALPDRRLVHCGPARRTPSRPRSVKLRRQHPPSPSKGQQADVFGWRATASHCRSQDSAGRQARESGGDLDHNCAGYKGQYCCGVSTDQVEVADFFGYDATGTCSKPRERAERGRHRHCAGCQGECARGGGTLPDPEERVIKLTMIRWGAAGARYNSQD